MDEAIQRDIETAARILRESGATEVFVFGSAATGKMRPDSDIDMAVRGIRPEEWFRVMSLVTMEISRPLDLIDLDANDPFAGYLQEKGRLRRVA